MEHNVIVDVLTQEGNTSLHWATFAGSVPVMEVFIDAGCKVDSPNEHGDRPLWVVVQL